MHTQPTASRGSSDQNTVLLPGCPPRISSFLYFPSVHLSLSPHLSFYSLIFILTYFSSLLLSAPSSFFPRLPTTFILSPLPPYSYFFLSFILLFLIFILLFSGPYIYLHLFFSFFFTSSQFYLIAFSSFDYFCSSFFFVFKPFNYRSTAFTSSPFRIFPFELSSNSSWRLLQNFQIRMLRRHSSLPSFLNFTLTVLLP